MIEIEGMVMLLSLPPIAVGLPSMLLTTMAILAPAFCAFLTLTVKLQLPRSIRGIEPAGTEKGSQPSPVETPAPSLM